MISAIALDDERSALDVIDAFCSQIDFIDLRGSFTRTGEARRFLAENPVDLLFSDINMPTESGIDFYRSMPQKTMVIFTTAYSEYAVESYQVSAVDYLLKPFSFGRFLEASNKAASHHHLLRSSEAVTATQQYPPYLFLRVDYGMINVVVADILFIEGLDNYVKIHRADQHPIVVRLTMKAILDKLSPTEFIRVHRSYIVPISKITSVRNKSIVIGEGDEIPISSSYERSFFTRFQ